MVAKAKRMRYLMGTTLELMFCYFSFHRRVSIYMLFVELNDVSIMQNSIASRPSQPFRGQPFVTEN